jgi:putative ABC transport system permease protein
MTGWTLAKRSLAFHWRSHLGVLLGATVAAAILVGALAVGDSVQHSLREMARFRLGGTQLALVGGSRFFRAEIAGDVALETKALTAPVALLRGTATAQTPSGDTRANGVQVLGVTPSFWTLGNTAPPFLSEEAAVLNDILARRLGVKVGDEVLLRVDKPSLLSRDAPLSTVEDATVPIRLRVSRIVADREFGRFSLAANQTPPLNVFVPLNVIQKKLGIEGRANCLLVGGRNDTISPGQATAALWKHWQFTDSGLDLRELKGRNVVELRTDRVFLDPPVGDAAVKAYPGAQGVLTYFVNELRVGNRAAPYSTVTAMDGSVVPPGMRENEVVINQWLADDLQAKPGDEVKLTYWLVGPMRKLILQSSSFRVRSILPMQGPAIDPDLMPPIPGLSDKKDCRDWDPGVPIELNKIRDKDQDYWSKYRGTPKAFITLAAGQRIWNNRFGNLTSVRYPDQGQLAGAIENCIRQALNPASLGLFFVPVREQAMAASAPATDFGQLFLGFSFFLIVAALLLTALLFAFGVEQRSEEVGTLLAVGFPPRHVQRLLLLEGAVIALLAGIAGSILAVLYTRAVIHGLSTIWSGAVANSALQFHVEPRTLAGGAVAGFLVALFSVWLVARKQARLPARQLLAAGAGSGIQAEAAKPGPRRSKRPGLITAVVCLLGAVAMAAGAARQHGEGAAVYFFMAGGLLLISGIALCRMLLARLERSASAGEMTIASLGVRNTSRRWGRSLAAVALLASGSFLVVAVGANRKNASEGAEERSSGTGGFALYGEASLPVYQDLNTAEGLQAFGLDKEDIGGAQFVAMRLREGDEASCLNLNRAQAPRLLGVDPEALRQRKAFTFGKVFDATSSNDPWGMLDKTFDDGAIPVVGDGNTVTWSLGKAMGDTLDYLDDRGTKRKLRIVGVLTGSILQGGLVMSERNFTALFPSQSGYQIFLIDAPQNAKAVSGELTRALEDVGLSLTPTAVRLADFNTVENTYLSIFALLGGLGLLLGSVGLGVVVLRNVLERRGELAVLRAVGFRKPALHWLVFSEHSLLLLLGLAVGAGSALLAVLPALRTPGTGAPFGSLALTLLAVLLSGALWTWAATALSLRGRLIGALRNE